MEDQNINTALFELKAWGLQIGEINLRTHPGEKVEVNLNALSNNTLLSNYFHKVDWVVKVVPISRAQLRGIV